LFSGYGEQNYIDYDSSYQIYNGEQNSESESYQCSGTLIFIERWRLCDFENDCPQFDDENEENCAGEPQLLEKRFLIRTYHV